jgi:hypothetical protein
MSFRGRVARLLGWARREVPVPPPVDPRLVGAAGIWLQDVLRHVRGQGVSVDAALAASEPPPPGYPAEWLADLARKLGARHMERGGFP